MSEFKSKLQEILKERPLSIWDTIIQKIKNKNNPIVIFGTKAYGEKLLRILQNQDVEVSCFCDNYFTSDTVYGLPCVSFEHLKENYKNAYILIATNSYYNEIKKQLEENGFTSENICPSVNYSNTTVDDILKSEDKWEYTYNAFQDDISRNVVLNKIKKLLYNDSMNITNNAKSSSDMYFKNDVLTFDDDEVYVDGGVYDGETITGYINAVNGKYREIHGFELDEENYNIAKQKIKESIYIYI